MKKWMSWILILAMMVTGACAETNEPLFETLAGIEWSFYSGVGAWSTDLRIWPDGTFKGEFHDSEMGETGDQYPYGTVYGCSFIGQLTLVEQVDERTWKLRVDELIPEKDQKDEFIEDGTRYVTTAEPYGISKGDEMLLYRPGMRLDQLPEEMILWTHTLELETRPETLDCWFLCSQKNESGFVGYVLETPAEP